MRLDEIGFLIKKNRKAKKLTQAELAEYSATGINTIKKIEAGFLDEVGIKKVEFILDVLDLEFSLRSKGRPLTLEELNEKF
jgi:transcriptional regulator with XRE-family HTH domain